MFLDVDNLFTENPKKKNVTSRIAYPNVHKKVMELSRLFPSGKVRRKIGGVYSRLNSDRYFSFNQNLGQEDLKDSIIRELLNHYTEEYNNYKKYFKKLD